MYEELNQSIEQYDESLPMPESKAVLGSELREGTHRFKIADRKIESNVPLKGKTGTYTRFEIRSRPVDVELIAGKSLGIFFAYNLKTSTKCGQFLHNQGVRIECLDNGRVKLVGLIGSCFEADVVHKEKAGLVYANIDRDTIEHVDCRRQESL
jgi:hypothetical protein